MIRSRSRTPILVAALVAVLSTVLAGGLVAGPAYAAAPTITSFTPTATKLRSTVTITGTNFAAPATVSFNGVNGLTTTVVSSTTITSVVPPTASTGQVAVTTPGGTVTSSQSLTVVPGVYLSPASGPPGATRTVFFSGFGASEAADVYFDTTAVTIGVTGGGGAANVAVTIPTSATPGTHWITVIGRRSGYSAQAAVEVRSDWPQFGHDVAHKNASPDTNLSDANVDRLDVSWRSPAYGFGEGSPAIVGGTVYEGFGDSTVRAFDEKTGALKWTRAVDGVVNDSAAVVGGSVYVGDDNGTMYSLNATTGAVNWSYSIGAGKAIRSSPAVIDGTVYFGGYDSQVHALTTAGSSLWASSADGQIVGSPAVAGGLVYVSTLRNSSSVGTVEAFNIAGGARAWTFTADRSNSNFYSSPMVAAGRVYVAYLQGEGEDTLVALKATTGAQDWSAFTFPSGSTAAFADHVVYQPGGYSNFTAYTPSGTQLQSKTIAGSAIGGALTLANGLGYYSAEYATYVFRLSDGTELATLPGSNPFAGPTVINGGVTMIEYAGGSLVHYTVDGGDTAPAVARPTVANLKAPR